MKSFIVQYKYALIAVSVLLAVLLYLHFHNKKKDKAEKYPGKKTQTGRKSSVSSSADTPATGKGIMETDPGMSATPMDTTVIMDSEGGHMVMPKGTNVSTGNPIGDILNIPGL